MTLSPPHRGALLIVAAALFWSSGGLGIKAIPDSALKVTFYRSAFASVALLLWFRPRVARLSPAFVVAVISYAACLTTFVFATKWTTAANAIFLQYSGVVWVLLLSPLVLGEPLKGRDVAAVVLAFGGMALFFVGDFDPTGAAGNWLAMLSGVFFASLVLSLRLQRGEAAEAAITFGSVLLSITLLPLVAGDLALQPRSFFVLLFLGLFQIAAAYALFVEGLKHLEATQASLIGLLEPIANPLWVFLFIGEKPRLTALVGAAIVLGAISWRTLAERPSERSAVADRIDSKS